MDRPAFPFYSGGTVVFQFRIEGFAILVEGKMIHVLVLLIYQMRIMDNAIWRRRKRETSRGIEFREV